MYTLYVSFSILFDVENIWRWKPSGPCQENYEWPICPNTRTLLAWFQTASKRFTSDRSRFSANSKWRIIENNARSHVSVRKPVSMLDEGELLLIIRFVKLFFTNINISWCDISFYRGYHTIGQIHEDDDLIDEELILDHQETVTNESALGSASLTTPTFRYFSHWQKTREIEGLAYDIHCWCSSYFFMKRKGKVQALGNPLADHQGLSYTIWRPMKVEFPLCPCNSLLEQPSTR